MSQEKVNKYKDQKANRKELIKKEKRNTALRRCAYIVVGLALVGWLTFSVVNSVDRARPRQVVEVDFQAVTDYMNVLQEEMNEMD